MPFNKVAEYGESENILDSAVGLVVKTRQATQAMATTGDDGRKVIKAGSLYTNPEDASDIGVVFTDYDMTDYPAYPIAVVVEGRLKKDKLASAAQATATELGAIGVRLV